MGISIGGIDLAKEIIELHFQLRRTQKLLELVINRSPVIGGVLGPDDIKLAEADALDYVQKKFPDMGIQKII